MALEIAAISVDNVTIPDQIAEHPADNLLGAFEEFTPYLKEGPWVRKLVRPLAEKYPWKFHHSIRVALLAIEMAEHLQIPQALRHPFVEAALCHDVGFEKLPDEIVNGGQLSEENEARMREHASLSIEAVAPESQSAAFLVQVVHLHALPGKAYPQNPSSKFFESKYSQNHPIALDVFGVPKLMTVIDVIDACRSERPYKKSMSELSTYDYISKLKDVPRDSDGLKGPQPLFSTEEGFGIVKFGLERWNNVQERFEEVVESVNNPAGFSREKRFAN